MRMLPDHDRTFDWSKTVVTVRSEHGNWASKHDSSAAKSEKSYEINSANFVMPINFVTLIAHVIVSKMCDHTSLHRLEYIFKTRHQVRLPRQTLDRWLHLGADWLIPIHQQIRTGVMAGGYVQLDETPIDYLEPGFGRAKQGYLWVGKKPDGEVFFQWETNRAAACLDRLVPADFSGTIQCDGYAGYPSFAKSRKGINLAACWAHARRKFHEALEASSRMAGWFLRQIAHLYEIEARLCDQKAGPKLRQAVRTHQSRPILGRIKNATTRIKTIRRPSPQSLLRKAIDYAQNLWAGLLVYVENGRIEIDNNLVENAIRPTAVGKKTGSLSATLRLGNGPPSSTPS
jgi:transposase